MAQGDTGFTQFPNYYLDRVMPKAGGVEWKLICTVIRDTLGWQRNEAEISIERFEQMTGAKRSRLFEALTAACKRGAIKRPEQRAFRFRPMPRANLQEVPKPDRSRRNQQKLPGFSESENRTLVHQDNPIIGLSESENRTLPLLRKKENTQACVSKFSRETRIQHAKAHGFGLGWLSNSEDGQYDWLIEMERDSQREHKPKVTIRERLQRERIQVNG